MQFPSFLISCVNLLKRKGGQRIANGLLMIVGATRAKWAWFMLELHHTYQQDKGPHHYRYLPIMYGFPLSVSAMIK